MQIKGTGCGFQASADDESHIWINETEIVNLRLGKNELNPKIKKKNAKLPFTHLEVKLFLIFFHLFYPFIC